MLKPCNFDIAYVYENGLVQSKVYLLKSRDKSNNIAKHERLKKLYQQVSRVALRNPDKIYYIELKKTKKQ